MPKDTSAPHAANRSFEVPLKAIDPNPGATNENDEEDVEFFFPRLDALLYGAADPSRFLIKVNFLNNLELEPTPKEGSGPGRLLVEVSSSDTVAVVKKQATRSFTFSPTDLGTELGVPSITVELEGKVLGDEQTVEECGIVSGSELSLVLPRGVTYEQKVQEGLEHRDRPAESETEVGAPRGVTTRPEAQKRNLVNKARGRVLFGWSGLTSDEQMLGLPLRPGASVMIGRVINQDWYEGYMPDNLNKCGYIPRNYVEIESLHDEAFRRSLGPAARGLPLSDLTSYSPLPRRRRRDWLFRLASPVSSIFSQKTRKRRSLKSGSIPIPAPKIPPSPFPQKPAVPTLDLLQQGSRVRLKFYVQHSADDYPIVAAVLTLVSAPQTRISYATVELEFEYDTIIELEPKRVVGVETEVHHNSSVTNELSAKGGTGQSLGPAGAGVNIKGARTATKSADFSRRTCGSVVGDGEGSSRAYWVFKEDPGEAGRRGLDSEQKMMVKLHARPVRVDYQVNAKVVADDGGTGGWFGSKRLSSGRQRFYLNV